MPLDANPTIAVIGCGTLGTALATGILAPKDTSDSPKFTIKHLIATVGTASSKQRVENSLAEHSARLTVLTQEENVRAAQNADVVLLAVKPSKREDVFSIPRFKEAIRGKIVISIMAGITTAELARLIYGNGDDDDDDEHSNSNERVNLQAIRAMPNMAARIRSAVTLYTSTPTTTPSTLSFTHWLFTQVRTAQSIPEKSFDICAVLVGCAGSLLLLAIDGLLDAAVVEGVRRLEVQDLVVNSAIGMMRLVPEAGDHPGVLREKIASPGGCSIRALLELERLGVRSAFTGAILKAAERSREMSGSR